MSYVTEWLRRLRMNDNFQPFFTTLNSKEDNSNVESSMSVPTVQVISVVAAPVRPQHCSKRLLSSTESKKKSVKRGIIIKHPIGGNRNLKNVKNPGDTKNSVDYVWTHGAISTCVID